MRWLKRAGRLRSGLIAILLVLVSCSQNPKPIDIEKLLQDFIGADLAMSPVTATQMGFHNYEGVNLDVILDDYSEQGMRGIASSTTPCM